MHQEGLLLRLLEERLAECACHHRMACELRARMLEQNNAPAETNIRSACEYWLGEKELAERTKQFLLDQQEQ